MRYVLFILFYWINLLHRSRCILLKVIEITRHGGRTPLRMKPEEYLQKELGQLTALGFNQHLLLGKWNRKRYIGNVDSEYKNFLPDEFDDKLIKVISSRFQRTEFSAIGNMLGMYPGISFKIEYNSSPKVTSYGKPPIVQSSYLDEINNKIVYLNIEDKKNDFISSMKNCDIILNFQSNKNFLKISNTKTNDHKELSELIDEYFTNNSREDSFKSNYLSMDEKRKLKDNLQNVFGSIFEDKNLNDLTLKDFSKITDFLNFYNFSYDSPDETFNFSTIKEILIKINLRYVTQFINNDRYLKIVNSSFTKNILNDLNEVVKDSSFEFERKRTKFILYSAHDRNIQNFILNLFDTEYLNNLLNKANRDNDAYFFLRVPFASSFIFELHKIDNEFYVRIIYNGIEIKENFKNIEVIKYKEDYTFKTIEKIQYIENKGFNYSDIYTLLDSRVEKNISDIICK